MIFTVIILRRTNVMSHTMKTIYIRSSVLFFVHICSFLVRDAKSEEHEERAPAIFPPAVLIFGLPMQKICLNMTKYAVLILWRKNGPMVKYAYLRASNARASFVNVPEKISGKSAHLARARIMGK